jgi:hypothetical protein
MRALDFVGYVCSTSCSLEYQTMEKSKNTVILCFLHCLVHISSSKFYIMFLGWNMRVDREYCSIFFFNSIFWVTPCCLLKVKQKFRRNISPLSSRTKNKPSKKAEWNRKKSPAWITLWPQGWSPYVPSKCQLNFNGGFASQKTEQFITTDVRTSNLTFHNFCSLLVLYVHNAQ